MVDLIELKRFINDFFRSENDITIDNDLEISLSQRRFETEDNKILVVKHNELEQIYNRIKQMKSLNLELINGMQYETAIELDRLYLRGFDDFNTYDSENEIEYKIEFCSIEYCIYLFMLLIEKGYNANKNRNNGNKDFVMTVEEHVLYNFENYFYCNLFILNRNIQNFFDLNMNYESFNDLLNNNCITANSKKAYIQMYKQYNHFDESLKKEIDDAINDKLM